MEKEEYRKRYAARLVLHGWPQDIADEAAEASLADFHPDDPEPEDHADDCHSYAMEDSR